MPDDSRQHSVDQAAKLGQEQAAREAKLQANIREARGERTERGEEMKKEEGKQLAGAKKKQKAFGVAQKKQKAGIEADKKRRADLAKALEDEQKAREEKRKKEKEYMDGLHTASEIKILREKRENDRIRELHGSREKADRDAALEKESGRRSESQKKEEILREARTKKSVLDKELNQALYQLDGWRRAQLQALDHELASVSPAQRGGVQSTFKLKRKNIENAFAEKKTQAMNDRMQKSVAIDENAKAAILSLERGEKSFEGHADQNRERKREDAEMKFERKKRDDTATSP